MKRRILKQKLNKVVVSCGKPVVLCDARYIVQEYNEVANDWETITYNSDFDTKKQAVFNNIEIAKLYCSDEVGVVEEEEIKMLMIGKLNI